MIRELLDKNRDKTYNQDDIRVAGLHFCGWRGVFVADKVFSVDDSDDGIQDEIAGITLKLSDLKG